MIAGIFHEGSGLGDQLFRYVTVRTLAQEKGFEWGMHRMLNWKGEFFSEWPWSAYEESSFAYQWIEKDIRDFNGLDVRSYDPEINFVQDNTTIDGSFEDSKYWHHNLNNILKWLAVEPLNVPHDLCVVGFRGGEYSVNPELFLTVEYYRESFEKMKEINPAMKFQVHTDDPVTAHYFFKDFEIEIVQNEAISHSKHSNMGFNWRSMRHAKYAIIPNSAFFILPRILKHYEDPSAVTIAPRYWARRNTRCWARPACYHKEFTYI